MTTATARSFLRASARCPPAAGRTTCRICAGGPGSDPQDLLAIQLATQALRDFPGLHALCMGDIKLDQDDGGPAAFDITTALLELVASAAGTLEALTAGFVGDGAGALAGAPLAALTRLQRLDIRLVGGAPHAVLLPTALPGLSALTALCLRLRYVEGQRSKIALGPMPQGLRELRCLCDTGGRHKYLARALRAAGPLTAVTRFELQPPEKCATRAAQGSACIAWRCTRAQHAACRAAQHSCGHCMRSGQRPCTSIVPHTLQTPTCRARPTRPTCRRRDQGPESTDSELDSDDYDEWGGVISPRPYDDPSRDWLQLIANLCPSLSALTLTRAWQEGPTEATLPFLTSLELHKFAPPPGYPRWERDAEIRRDRRIDPPRWEDVAPELSELRVHATMGAANCADMFRCHPGIRRLVLTAGYGDFDPRGQWAGFVRGLQLTSLSFPVCKPPVCSSAPWQSCGGPSAIGVPALWAERAIKCLSPLTALEDLEVTADVTIPLETMLDAAGRGAGATLKTLTLSCPGMSLAEPAAAAEPPREGGGQLFARQVWPTPPEPLWPSPGAQTPTPKKMRATNPFEPVLFPVGEPPYPGMPTAEAPAVAAPGVNVHVAEVPVPPAGSAPATPTAKAPEAPADEAPAAPASDDAPSGPALPNLTTLTLRLSAGRGGAGAAGAAPAELQPPLRALRGFCPALETLRLVPPARPERRGVRGLGDLIAQARTANPGLSVDF